MVSMLLKGVCYNLTDNIDRYRKANNDPNRFDGCGWSFVNFQYAAKYYPLAHRRTELT